MDYLSHGNGPSSGRVTPIDDPAKVKLPLEWRINRPVWSHQKSGWAASRSLIGRDCVPIFTNPCPSYSEETIGTLEDAVKESIDILDNRIEECRAIQQELKEFLNENAEREIASGTRRSVRKLFDTCPETGNIRHCASVAVPSGEVPPTICIPGQPSSDPTSAVGVKRTFWLKHVCDTPVYVEEGCAAEWMLEAHPLQAMGEPGHYTHDIS